MVVVWLEKFKSPLNPLFLSFELELTVLLLCHCVDWRINEHVFVRVFSVLQHGRHMQAVCYSGTLQPASSWQQPLNVPKFCELADITLQLESGHGTSKYIMEIGNYYKSAILSSKIWWFNIHQHITESKSTLINMSL